MDLKCPKALLLDLDDTIVNFSIPRIHYWNTVTKKHKECLAPVKAETVSSYIIKWGDWFWDDNGRNMKWRFNLKEARRHIVALAFDDLGIGNTDLAFEIADDFTELREKGENLLTLVPGSLEAIKHLRGKGIKLALLTNGSSEGQRSKIQRFSLEPFFDHILIEEEVGFGKPDPRVYLKALNELQENEKDTWMIGDNPLWDVTAPQKLGIKGVWVKRSWSDEPSKFRPFLKIDSFPEIMKYLK